MDSSATIIAAFFKPTKAIKNPIPAPIANFSCCGIALITTFLILVTEISTKTIPERNTAANAACHEYPI